MIHGTWTFALCIVAAAVAAVLPTATSYAENIGYVSANGAGTACTSTAPCGSLETALTFVSPPSRIICVGGSGPNNNNIEYAGSFQADIDCPQGYLAQFSVEHYPTTLRVRHLGFRYAGFSSLIAFMGSGTLILEDCVFTDATSNALDIEPNGPLDLVIRNSRISNSAAGILLKPTAGGSIKATLDHVTITSNTGGGIKTDSTNGVVNLDITDSEISNNGGNGINQVGSANQNMLNVSRTVIAKNGVAGLQANGATAAALVDTTLFDTNASGATTVVNSGHILSYGNNRIVGSAGAGFTGSAGLQ
jgi:hypothetical protein